MAKQLILGTDRIDLTESLNVAGDKNIEIKADGKKYYATLWEKGKSVVNAISIGLVKIGTNKYGILTSPVRGQQELHQFFPVFNGGTTQERKTLFLPKGSYDLFLGTYVGRGGSDRATFNVSDNQGEFVTVIVDLERNVKAMFTVIGNNSRITRDKSFDGNPPNISVSFVLSERDEGDE
jgi:hypothetical protein